MYLSFDEWNVWYQQRQKQHDREIAPDLLDDRYSLLDALVVGGLGMTLLNNADRVKIACLAQLVNVIAPIITEKNGRVVRQSTYYPFRDISRYGRGTVLKPVVITPSVETCHGDAPLLYTSVVYDEEDGYVTVFCLNIDQSSDLLLELDMRSFGKLSMEEHICLREMISMQ